MPADLVPGKIRNCKTYSYEETSFTAADSPRELDVYTDMDRSSVDGYFICDGDGDIIISFTYDGISYGSKHTIKKNEVFSLTNIDIKKIKVEHSGTDSSYRCMVI